jgi:hypothetical protein
MLRAEQLNAQGIDRVDPPSLEDSGLNRLHKPVFSPMFSAIRRLGLALQFDQPNLAGLSAVRQRVGTVGMTSFGKFKSSSGLIVGRLFGKMRVCEVSPGQQFVDASVLPSLYKISTHFVVAYCTGHLLGKSLLVMGVGSDRQTHPHLMIALGVGVGAIRGFVSSWSGSSGDIQEGAKGAVGGALFGAIQGHYGERWTAARVVQQSLVGAVASGLHSGEFSKGLKRSLLLSSLTYIAAITRAYECAHSSMTPRQVGFSPGVLGSPGKIAGERINAQQFSMLNEGRSVPQSLGEGTFEQDLSRYLRSRYLGSDIYPDQQEVFGLFQGDPGRLFGYTYPPGGFVDRVVESFAGIHDFLNHPWFYNADGTSHYFLHRNSPLSSRLGATINAVNVLLALPVGLSALVPSYMYPYLSQFVSSRRGVSS